MRTVISRSLAVVLGVLLASCGGGGGYGGGGSSVAPTPTPTPAPTPTPTPTPAPTPTPSPTPAPTPTAYSVTNLVSDGSVTAQKTDPNLKNPWGIVFAPNAPVWLVNNGTQTATVYDGTGLIRPVVVTLPGGIRGAADPTGIVNNTSTTDFLITKGTTSGAARFIFDGEGGTIIGWNPTVDAGNGIIAYDDGNGGAVYKGLAIAADGTNNFLFATDFHNNKVDVFDKTFTKVTTTGGFTDPTLPAGYAPFGIQAITANGTTRIYVTYAQTLPTSDDNANGAGLGVVNVFDVHGALQTHLIGAGGKLNAPWGIAVAPANFGTYSNNLLIGNFGDGVINAFDAATGAYAGTLADSNGTAFANPGLWGIGFGNGAQNQPATTLYFAAGIANEAGGLYGRIDLGATSPDTVAPTVTLTAPAAASTVAGTVAVTADANDDKGVASVEFLLGTTSLGKVTAAPFTVNWNTTGVANGAASLTAVALDAAGNKTTSPAVSVTVNNPPAATLTTLQANIFGPKCSTCHTGIGTLLPGSMNLTSAASTFAALVDVNSEEQPTLKRVKPGDSANSWVIHKLEGTNLGTTMRMPFGGPFLDQPTIDTVKSWINAGALNN